jgi:hypothetical protein
MIQALRHEGQLQVLRGPVLKGKEVKVLTEWVRRGEVWSLKLFGK